MGRIVGFVMPGSPASRVVLLDFFGPRCRYDISRKALVICGT